MSAYKAEQDWRWIRAYCALDAHVRLRNAGHISHIPFAHYVEIFDLDADEVVELFDDVARAMRVSVWMRQDHTYH